MLGLCINFKQFMCSLNERRDYSSVGFHYAILLNPNELRVNVPNVFSLLSSMTKMKNLICIIA